MLYQSRPDGELTLNLIDTRTRGFHLRSVALAVGCEGALPCSIARGLTGPNAGHFFARSGPHIVPWSTDRFARATDVGARSWSKTAGLFARRCPALGKEHRPCPASRSRVSRFRRPWATSLRRCAPSSSIRLRQYRADPGRSWTACHPASDHLWCAPDSVYPVVRGYCGSAFPQAELGQGSGTCGGDKRIPTPRWATRFWTLTSRGELLPGYREISHGRGVYQPKPPSRGARAALEN